VIFDVHGEPFRLRIQRGPLRYRPREQHPVEFEAEVVPVEDTAKSLTSAIVFLTTVLLLVAIIVIIYAMGKWYNQGMFASK